jgi:hypothetical protein
MFSVHYFWLFAWVTEVISLIQIIEPKSWLDFSSIPSIPVHLTLRLSALMKTSKKQTFCSSCLCSFFIFLLISFSKKRYSFPCVSLSKNHAKTTYAECRYRVTIFYLGTGWRWVVSFAPRPSCTLDRRLGGAQSRSGRCGIENFFPLCRETNPGRPAVARCYTDWAILAYNYLS